MFRSLCLFSAVLMHLQLLASEPTVLFVSLGSTCVPANFTRTCDIRTASFPLDWILSFDNEKLIEILEDDFLHFFNMEYIVPTSDKVLLNTYYHFEFLHEVGNWATQFQSTMQDFKERYERRIARFRNLKNFPGKIFFIRAASHIPVTQVFFKLNEEYSFRLHEALKRYFPNTNFTLIIMNFNEDEKLYVVQKKWAAHLLVVTGPNVKLPEDNSLCDIFHRLVDEH